METKSKSKRGFDVTVTRVIGTVTDGPNGEFRSPTHAALNMIADEICEGMAAPGSTFNFPDVEMRPVTVAIGGNDES